MAEVVRCSDCGKEYLRTRLIKVRGESTLICFACQVKRVRKRTPCEPCRSDKIVSHSSWYRDTEWFVKVFCAQCGHPEWASRSKWKPPPGYVEPKEPSMWDVPLT